MCFSNKIQFWTLYGSAQAPSPFTGLKRNLGNKMKGPERNSYRGEKRKKKIVLDRQTILITWRKYADDARSHRPLSIFFPFMFTMHDSMMQASRCVGKNSGVLVCHCRCADDRAPSACHCFQLQLLLPQRDRPGRDAVSELQPRSELSLHAGTLRYEKERKGFFNVKVVVFMEGHFAKSKVVVY